MTTAENPSKTWTRLSWLVVASLGVVESLYGRMQYLGDSISYLNVSRAVSALDWRAIFDPMWNPGYPILVAAMRSLFPKTPSGEWYAIGVLNWAIYLVFYAAWRTLLRNIVRSTASSEAGSENRPAIVAITASIFVVYSLCFDSLGLAAPDMLVSTLFLAACTLLLRLLVRPSVQTAILLGLAAGIGYWVKGVFLAFSFIFFSTLLLGLLMRRMPLRTFWIAAAAFLAIFAPLVAATSLAFGHFALGTTGSLNYAFHVNNMPHFTNWQGGPAEFGAPLHHTRQLIADLPVFGFPTPFHTTNAPYNNLAYWYIGYRHFYSLTNQFWAIVADLILLRGLATHPFIYAVLLASFAVLLRREWRASLRKTPGVVWFIFLAALLGFASYMLVHIEARYLSPFLLVFSLFPLLPLLDPALKSKRALIGLLLLCYPPFAVAELAVKEGPTFLTALRRTDFHTSEQWRISDAMPGFGLPPGSPVALINDTRDNARCSWAYSSQLRIVAQFGGLPIHEFTGQELLRHPFSSSWISTDYTSIFRGLTPERQAQVLDAFRKEGALAVVSYAQPVDKPGPGWKAIPGTGAWIYRFPG